ncbi:hypothetical protein [Krasilnikovia sp. MM14-A1259]|uniref:hypothetical protein n=1 Tax=Krasilnikovia sp. MM14-A1259 TaxID=3373539 RepID=UPI0037F16FB9
MEERLAVTGYLPDAAAEGLPERAGQIDIRPERGYRDVAMRVDSADVMEVRVGSSAQGETLVQLFLREGARVETVVAVTADVEGLARLNDPTLARLIASATAKVIVS